MLCPPDQSHEQAYLSSIGAHSKPRTIERKAATLRYFHEFIRSIRWPISRQSRALKIANEQRFSTTASATFQPASIAGLADSFASSQSNARTRRAYSSDLRRLTEVFGARSSQSLSVEEITTFLEELRESLKPSTMRRLNATIRAFFGWLAQNGCCDRLKIPYVLPAPAPGAGRLAAGKLAETTGRIRRLGLPARDEVIVRLLLLGMTPAEIVTLRVEDVDFARHRLTVRSKQQRARFLSVDGVLSAALRDYLHELSERTGAVIRNTRGTVLTTRSVGRVVSQFAKRAGLAATVNPQALRRASAQAARLSGADALDVKHALGLAGAGVTRKYL